MKKILINTLIAFSLLFGGASALAGNTIYFSGDKNNDLFVLLKSEGWKVERFNSPKDAVAKAKVGSPVIIIASNYPNFRTWMDADIYAKAKEKNLRMYVEYSQFIPGIETEEQNYLGKLERVVVTDINFFNKQFESLAILGLSHSHIIPVDENAVNSILSYAKVAGYNKADFGLEGTKVYPLLFEVDNVLFATSCLTCFKMASYRPVESWEKVWSNILHWLTGEEFVFQKWTSDPRPMYDSSSNLPESAREDAIKKGAEWFFKSKFIIHPEWYPDLMKIAGDGSHPVGEPILDEWNYGDGSFGVLEGHVSNVHHDGTQDVRYMIRNDVQGESAFALAISGNKIGNSNYQNVSKNLLDFLFYTSNARKGLRNEKESPAYAMLGWADATPYFFYNDDHARALLGAVGAAACLNDTSWNQRIVETILANFRLSSREGFIGNRISENELLNNGWEYYNKRTFISPHPHFESWIWACYLWLYDKTGYEPLLKKAKKAIEITMNAYPKLWKWTNGIQQERARMILPLAWLVRVEDKPEHREWLNYMVDELLRFQQPSGAIREELGTNNMGQHGATTSNAEYGDDEAPLIANNGDPASDMLYTSNFAFFSLNEAAKVTQKAEHKKAVENLADFLVRIQVKSDTQKSIDGAWFRGFDYELWDYWGSNADEEWGVWCTLTGWIQSWIVATMVLVDENKSFWDLTKDVNIKHSFDNSLWMLESDKK